MPDALVRIVFQDTGAEAGANRVSAALQRLERNEPTRALRQTRAAMDELATSATGLHPGIARLASTLTMFGIGGVAGIAAVGGLAAVGLEVKSLLNIVPNLEKSFRTLNDEFAKMGGPGAISFSKLEVLHDRLTKLAEGGWQSKILGALRWLGGGKSGEGALGQFEDVERIGQATEETTLRLEIFREHAQAMKLHTEALKKEAIILAERRATGIRNVLTGGGAGQRGNAGLAAVQTALGLPESFDVGIMGIAGRTPGLPGESPMAAADRFRSADTRRNIELSVGAAMSVISGLSQGGAGGAIGGLGAGATALSGLSNISTGAANILGPLGIGLSALSSVFGLFGHKEPAHVIIDGYDAHALTQQQQLLLALTGFKGLSIDILSAGGDVNRVLYALGRQSRTDGNMRVPPGSR